MALGHLSREAVLRAIAEHDEIGREAFLERYGFGRATAYELEVDGKTYDPKAIAGVAYGFDHAEEGPKDAASFSGGLETARSLKSAGFEVKHRAEPEVRQLKDLLEEFMAGYLDAKRDTFGRDHPIQQVMRNLVAVYKTSYPVADRPNIIARGSTGQGNWAAAPWVAFLDRRETSTTQTGVYAVLLFREDMTGAYMTLAQGTTVLAREHGRDHMRTVLRNTAQSVYPLIGSELTDLGFRQGSDIELGSRNLARNYTDSTIVHKFYPAGSVPADSELLADLEGVLDLSDRYIEAEVPKETAEPDHVSQELIHVLQEHHNIVLEGVPGTGKSYAVEGIAACWEPTTGRELVRFGDQSFAATVMHPSTSYEDFIEGLRPTVPSTGTSIARRFDESAHGDGQFRVADGFFLRCCVAAVRNPDRDVLILLDELNRCNIPSVLGDLLLTLEGSKRARFTEAADWDAPVSVTLPYSGRTFFVPDNLYVIATTNTTDRSVAPIDAAIRRRFAFIRLDPEFAPALSAADGLDVVARDLLATTVTQLVSLNEVVLGPCLGPDALLGQSYAYVALRRLNSATASSPADIISSIWRFTILPQLIDGVRSFGAEDLLADTTRDRWFADHGNEADGVTAEAREALNDFDAWMTRLGISIVVEGTGLSRGARVRPMEPGKPQMRLDIADEPLTVDMPTGDPTTVQIQDQ